MKDRSFLMSHSMTTTRASESSSLTNNSNNIPISQQCGFLKTRRKVQYYYFLGKTLYLFACDWVLGNVLMHRWNNPSVENSTIFVSETRIEHFVSKKFLRGEPQRCLKNEDFFSAKNDRLSL